MPLDTSRRSGLFESAWCGGLGGEAQACARGDHDGSESAYGHARILVATIVERNIVSVAMMNRRQFIRAGAAGAAGFARVVDAFAAAPNYDLVITVLAGQPRAPAPRERGRQHAVRRDPDDLHDRRSASVPKSRFSLATRWQAAAESGRAPRKS
jgi:hypothetical protein